MLSENKSILEGLLKTRKHSSHHRFSSSAPKLSMALHIGSLRSTQKKKMKKWGKKSIIR